MAFVIEKDAFGFQISRSDGKLFKHPDCIEKGVQNIPNFLFTESFPMTLSCLDLLFYSNIVMLVVELCKVFFTSNDWKSVHTDSDCLTLQSAGRYRLLHSICFPMVCSLSYIGGTCWGIWSHFLCFRWRRSFCGQVAYWQMRKKALTRRHCLWTSCLSCRSCPKWWTRSFRSGNYLFHPSPWLCPFIYYYSKLTFIDSSFDRILMPFQQNKSALLPLFVIIVKSIQLKCHSHLWHPIQIINNERLWRLGFEWK